MVFQTYAIFPHMTVRENMAFGLTSRRDSKAEKEEKVAEAARNTLQWPRPRIANCTEPLP